MVAYFASRKRLWSYVAVLVGALLVIRAIADAIYVYVPEYRYRNDFRLLYGAVLTTFHDGYSHLYDPFAQRAAVEGLGPGFYWSLFLNPPPLVWLATPFATLPFAGAIVLWTILLLAAAALTWYLAAPGAGLAKAGLGLLWLGVVPVSFGIGVGQSVVLVAAAVASAWWLAEHDRPVWAGLALSLIAFKPQLALLVPFCLAVSGHAKVFGAWLLASVFMALVSLALLGHDGVERFREALAIASQWEITRSYAVSGLIGTGPQLYVAQAIAAIAALAAAWRWRGRGPAIPIVAGITGSLLFTPYVGFQDFAMLVLAGWLLAREHPTPTQVALLVVGFALLQLVLSVLAVPILVAEVLLLASVIYHVPRETRRAAPVTTTS
ncbi:MAG TPA: glycosyltransferase family 87 protein [Candidatus Dormibacteraeota bacterium]|nr:glycosyltransferase family 87 protein [Candidatus Dormibacteraeota bacterium]